jgi:hypothetical protein
MAAPACHNCVYSICDPELWLRRLWAGEPLLPRCANHPRWPGQLCDVPGVACRNYRPKPALPSGDVRLIPLGDSFYAYVDAADYEWLSQWTWYMCAGGYAGRTEKGTLILLHRAIMKPPKGMVVDHIDGNRANNCRFNLRVCTRRENERNKRKRRGTSSPYKGVYRERKTGKYYATCIYQGEHLHRGRFDDEIEAARAYDRAAAALLDAYAPLNFPKEWPPGRRTQVYADAQPQREALDAKIAALKRRRAQKARAKSQKAEGKGQKKNKRTPPRAKTPRGPKRKRPAQDAKQATKNPPAKTRRARKPSEAA